jgi:hypothetical protein
MRSGLGPSALISRGGAGAAFADFADVDFGAAFGVAFFEDLAGGAPFDDAFFFLGRSESSSDRKPEESELDEIARSEPESSADLEAFAFDIVVM